MTIRIVRWLQGGRLSPIGAVMGLGLAAAVLLAVAAEPPASPDQAVAPVAQPSLHPVAVALDSGASVVYAPAAAHATGAVGTNWRTDLEVHNPGSTQAAYSIALLKHATDNTSPAEQGFTLAPGASARYADLLWDRFSFSGKAALRVTATGGTILATSRTYNDQPEGTYGQFVPAFDTDGAIAAPDEGRLIQLSNTPGASSSGFRTNLGVVNATSAAITVTVTLYQANGTALGQVPLSLRPYDFQQVDRIFERVTAAVVGDGYAVVRATPTGAKFFAYASVIDNRTGDPVFIPAARVSATGPSPTATPSPTTSPTPTASPTPSPTPTQGAGAPNLMLYTPPGWANCVVCNQWPSDPPVTVQLGAGATTYVYWSLANLGTATLTGPVKFGLFLDGTRILNLTWSNSTGLEANHYVTFQPATITVNDPGNHVIAITADPDGQIAETSEADNTCSFSGFWAEALLGQAAGAIADDRPGDDTLVAAADPAPLPLRSASVTALAVAQTLVIPSAAHLTGTAGTNWRTDLELHNPGPGQAACTVALLKHASDNGAPTSKAFTLAAGQAIRFSDVLTTQFAFSGKAALRLTVTSGTVLATSRTYNDPGDGTYGQFVPAIPDGEAIAFSEEGRLIQLSHQPDAAKGGFRTNLGLVNAGATPIDVTISLFSADGTALGAVPASLRAYEYQQLDKVFERVTSAALAAGYAVVRTSTGGGRFFAYASVIDNRTGDPVFIPAQKPASAFTYGPPRIVTVNTGAATEVADPTTGVTFVFPQGGHGSLTTATIVSGPFDPSFGGTGFHFAFTGSELVKFKLPLDASAETQVYAFGYAYGCLDGGPPRGSRWFGWPESSSQGGSLLYDLPAAPPATEIHAARAGDVGAAAATKPSGGDFFIKKIKSGDLSYQRQSLTRQQVLQDAATLIGLMPAGLQSAAQQQMSANFRTRIYDSSLNVSDRGNAYVAFSPSATGAVVFDPHFEFNLSGLDLPSFPRSVAHETGHMMNHVVLRAQLGNAAGDAVMQRIVLDLAPPAGHQVGDLRAPRVTTTEEPAFVSQYYFIGVVDTVRPNDAYILRNTVDNAPTPDKADLPSVEGFGFYLLANLTRTEATILDWSGKSAPAPPIGLSWGDVWSVVAQGATTIDEYRANIEATLNARALPDRLGIVAERVGWSYHGTGSVYATGTSNPVAGATVTNFVKIGATEYVASQGVSDASGKFTLTRVIPGCSKLRVAKNQQQVDYSYCAGWDRPTTEAVDLQSWPIGVAPTPTPTTPAGMISVPFSMSWSKKNSTFGSLYILPESIDFDWNNTASGTLTAPCQRGEVSSQSPDGLVFLDLWGCAAAGPITVRGTFDQTPAAGYTSQWPLVNGCTLTLKFENKHWELRTLAPSPVTSTSPSFACTADIADHRWWCEIWIRYDYSVANSCSTGAYKYPEEIRGTFMINPYIY